MRRFFDFLVKKFIKDYENLNDDMVRERYGWLGGIIGIIINSTILSMELIVGLLLNSIAITADAFHNLTDAVSSLITIFSFKLANKPADEKHPFGYGRVEYLTSLLFSFAILVVGYEFIKSSYNRIMHPVVVPFNIVSFLFMLLALPLQITLNRFTNYIGKKINSSALQASALESFTDILVLSMVIFSLLVTRFTTFPVDGYVGIIVSIFIIHSGVGLLKDTIDTLLGKAPSPELTREIYRQLLTYDYITGAHDLVVHSYGPGRYMASIHAEVPAEESVLELHDVIDKAEHEIGEKLNIYLVIHMDPIKKNDPEVKSLREQTRKVVHEIPGIISMHDFRVVGDGQDRSLVFDVVISKKYYSNTYNKEVLRKIQKGIKNISPNYLCSVTFDRDYN